MPHALLRVLPALLLTPLSSGCVLAVREIAVAKHKTNTAERIRARYPSGTPVEDVRSGLTAQGYACADGLGADGVILTCDPVKRTGAIFKGNWRLAFKGQDGRVTTVRAVRSPKPAKAIDQHSSS
jgi:hypothetical protein